MNQSPSSLLRCGTIAIIGAPNAGKSTLVNQLVGQKVAITSPKAQTTRTRMLGIALHEQVQMVLIDTPGIFETDRRFDKAMVSAAWDGARDADIIALMVDGRVKLSERVRKMASGLSGRRERCILLLNKVDQAKKEKLLILAEELVGLADFEEIFFVSALTGDGMAELKSFLANAMPESAWHYPEDQVSDVSQRILAAEITREQIYRQLHQELPYASLVVPESYTQRKDGSVEIGQQIMVQRDSHRVIMLGKGGAQIKSIGEKARKELQQMLGCKVHLFLHVKVQPDWDEKKEFYDTIGLEWKK